MEQQRTTPDQELIMNFFRQLRGALGSKLTRRILIDVNLITNNNPFINHDIEGDVCIHLVDTMRNEVWNYILYHQPIVKWVEKEGFCDIQLIAKTILAEYRKFLLKDYFKEV